MITQSAQCYPEPAAHRSCPGYVVKSTNGMLVQVDCTCECHERLRVAIRNLVTAFKRALEDET